MNSSERAPTFAPISKFGEAVPAQSRSPQLALPHCTLRRNSPRIVFFSNGVVQQAFAGAQFAVVRHIASQMLTGHPLSEGQLRIP